MSALGDIRTKETETFKIVNKCRIPQRLTQTRQRVTVNKARGPNNFDNKSKFEVVSVQQPRMNLRNAARPRSDESRPRSANRQKDDTAVGKQAQPLPRPTRPEKLLPAPRRPSTIPRRVPNDYSSYKTARGVITVPVTQKLAMKNNNMHVLRNAPESGGLPDQETIKKQEELEVGQSGNSDTTQTFHELYEKDSISSRNDKAKKLRNSWQEKITLFEKMKKDLSQKQASILELYAKMRVTNQKMSAVGQKTNLPPAEELRIMNVAKMTPDQLLQLCSNSKDCSNLSANDKAQRDDTQLSTLAVGLYNMPSKLVATCEQTLLKRKEIIDWFESLQKIDKGIGMHVLSKKINEFNAENEMLKNSLEMVKSEISKEISEIVEFIKKGVNDTITLQMRVEEMTYTLSELNSKNVDLQKQIFTLEHLKPNKPKLEELENELREEKRKKSYFKDRLTRAEGQVKINQEQVSQLEAALEQARSRTWTLERTVQQLHEQNQKLQGDFDKELNKLTESIRENTTHLEEIADAREKLQTEKEDLQKHLNGLAENYNESVKNLKHEMNVNVAKFIDMEKKYNETAEERNKLKEKVEAMSAQILESELRHKDLVKQIQEKEMELDKTTKYEKELEAVKRELDVANSEIEEYRIKLVQQCDAIAQIERNFKESANLEETLKCDLSTKEEYIAELEKKQLLLEQQLLESENKMGSYEEQLSSLKSHIHQLQKDFGQFENLSELHDMVTEQRASLLEATRDNSQLAEALQKKEIELENHIEQLNEQENLIAQKDGVIKMLTDKDEEQANIIKLLRNNLEMRAQADTDFNQQIAEKNAEIASLLSNLEKRKQQTCQLEKIILALEDQTKEASLQRRKDQEMIKLLEKKVNEFEMCHLENTQNIDAPPGNLDNLIKILEDELKFPFISQMDNSDQYYDKMSQNKYASDRMPKRDRLEKFECHEGNHNTSMYQTNPDTIPTKIVMGNYVKKTYISKNDEQIKGDNLDRKKAITNMDTQKWKSITDSSANMFSTPPSINDNINYPLLRGMPSSPKEHYLTRNLQFLLPNQLRDEKKCKMFKLAGHRL